MKIIKHKSGRELCLKFWFFGWFGKAKLPYAGCMAIWAWEPVRPSWYWRMGRIKCFASLWLLAIWQQIKERTNEPMCNPSPSLWWEVSRTLYRGKISV